MFKLGNRKSYWQVSETLVDLRRTQKYGKSVTLPAQPQEVIFDLEHAAVIVIDMQNDFCTPGGWLDSIGVDTSPLLNPVSRLNRLIPEAAQSGSACYLGELGQSEDRMNVPPSVLHVYNSDGRGNGIGDPLPGNGSKVLEKGSWGTAIVDGLDSSPMISMWINIA